MKKKLLSMLFVLSMLCVFMPIVANAATSGNCGKDGANVTWTLDDEGTLTISGEGDMEDYEYSSYAPWYGRSITKAVIEQGVTSIGTWAFYECSGLTSVTIPDSVTSICDHAFYYCSGKDVYYNGSYKDLVKISIGSDNSNLTNFTIHCNDFEASKWGKCGDTVAWFLDDEGTLTISGEGDMEDYDLYNPTAPWYDSRRSSITKAVIEQGVTSIGTWAFCDCDGITSVEIPDSVTSIGRDAFEYCDNVDSVYISDLTAYLNIDFGSSSANPMYCADNLYLNGKRMAGTLEIPDGITKIPYCAFDGCDGITSVEIPDSVTSIGSYAFRNCSGLTDVYYNGSYKDLAKISIGSSNDNLTNSTIHCNNFETSNWGTCGSNVAWFLDNEGTLTIIGEGDMKNYYSSSSSYAPWYSIRSSITKVIIEQGVTSIGNEAFYKCSGLTSVTIPDSVTSIDYGAFEDCSGLDSVYISDLTAYLNIDFGSYSANPMYYADKLYLNNKRVAGTVKIPDGVTKISCC